MSPEPWERAREDTQRWRETGLLAASQAGRQAGRRPCERFPTVQKRPVVQTSCTIELSRANKLHRSPLSSPQTVAATAPKIACLYLEVSDKNKPVWNILCQWWIYCTRCQSCNLNLSSSHLLGHALSFSSREVVQQGQNAQRKNPWCFP